MPLTAGQLDKIAKLSAIFLPYATSRRERAIKNGGRFAHYTSADAALKIISSKSIWMRNATCMSDFREVQYGFQLLRGYVEGNRTKFDSALDSCFTGVAAEALKLFDGWWQSIQLQSYITSISEHDASEDLHGRLSMWRAFGGSTARVALIMKAPLALGVNANLGAMLSPVAYFDGDNVTRELDSILGNVRANQEFLKGGDRQVVVNSVFMMLATAVVSRKHEGFHEEREWRVIHFPKVFPSPHIPSSIEVIGGVPQLVYKIPFKDNPEAELSGLEPRELLDRVIIGPTQFPWAMYEAFVAALESAGIPDAASRVRVSEIPVRT
jgi:hypothetical protein